MRSRDDILDEDDFFKDSRMSFGDHLEVLRRHLWRAIAGLAFCLCIGFVLDAIGDALDVPWLGVGKPLMAVIRAPVQEALTGFYNKRIKNFEEKKNEAGTLESQIGEPSPIRMHLDKEEVAKIRGVEVDKVPEEGVEIAPV